MKQKVWICFERWRSEPITNGFAFTTVLNVNLNIGRIISKNIKSPLFDLLRSYVPNSKEVSQQLNGLHHYTILSRTRYDIIWLSCKTFQLSINVIDNELFLNMSLDT